MRNYCTLFNSKYLIRGLALYYSLIEKSANAFLYIYAFDDLAYETLKKLNLAKAMIIKLSDFEDEKLLEIKNTRTAGEYCWTCTPSVVLHSIQKYNLSDCTYIDADLYFFNDPEILIEEMERKEKSILLTEHRYTEIYNQEKTSGIYCVQFMTFKNDKEGLEALNWWREKCIEWCYARSENGKFGDQKYLDDWKDIFVKVHVLENLGGGVAPWNVQQYKISRKDDEDIYLKKNEEEFKLIFYHFHSFPLYENFITYGDYEIRDEIKEQIYNLYREKLLGIKNELEKKCIKENYDFSRLSFLKKTGYLKKEIKNKIKKIFQI